MPTMKLIAVLWAGLLAAPRPAGAVPSADTGFLVLAPDRGFLANGETQEAFEGYRKGFKASLALLGPSESAASIREALLDLRAQGAREIVALPLFLSGGHPWLEPAREILGREKPPILLAPALAGHYLLAEMLADRLGPLSHDPAREALILVAQGARDAGNAGEIEADLLKTFSPLRARFPFARLSAVALEGWDPLRDPGGRSDARLDAALEAAKRETLKPVLVPLDLTTKMDSMMSLSTRLRGAARRYEAAFDGADLTPHPTLALWLAQESNRRLPVSEKELGVVFMAHGADLHWNRLMLRAIEPLGKKYMIEPAFGMADPLLIARAVRRLEARGARAIAVIRVFSMKESFKQVTEYALGLGGPPGPSGPHAHAGHGGSQVLPAPIRSACVLATEGGIEDSPLFASALADRALALSRRPDKETVFLLAHGAEDEGENAAWLRMLESLASQVGAIAAGKGARFRAVRTGAWREDWPEKRDPAALAIREEVRRASLDGAAIVIPARTALGGPERELLSGLEYAYAGESFAPHPKFAEWVEERILDALKNLNSSDRGGSAAPSR